MMWDHILQNALVVGLEAEKVGNHSLSLPDGPVLTEGDIGKLRHTIG